MAAASSELGVDMHIAGVWPWSCVLENDGQMEQQRHRWCGYLVHVFPALYQEFRIIVLGIETTAARFDSRFVSRFAALDRRRIGSWRRRRLGRSDRSVCSHDQRLKLARAVDESLTLVLYIGRAIIWRRRGGILISSPFRRLCHPWLRSRHRLRVQDDVLESKCFWWTRETEGSPL